MSTATVVVAACFRPAHLSRCLDALRSQTRPPEEVIVVCQDADQATLDCAIAHGRLWPALRAETIDRAGTVAAYNLGLSTAGGDLVAFVDDDAVPASDWLERILSAYGSDPRIAAVGGRDLIPGEDRADRERRWGVGGISVGRIQWPGRMTANHHLGSGLARDVDVLKGVNMSFRRSEVIRHGFDDRLLGEGAQVHAELTACLPLRTRGLRVVYDPAIRVQHNPAPRPYGGQRGTKRPAEVFVSAHNEALAILDYLPRGRRAVFALWCLIVGNTESPGLLVFFRDLKHGRPASLARARAAQRGRATAWRTRRAPRRSPSPGRPGEVDRRQPATRAGPGSTG